MTLDQLLAVLVVVMLVNLVLVVAVAFGGPLGERWRSKSSATVGGRSSSQPNLRAAEDLPRRRASDSLPTDLAELLHRTAPLGGRDGASEGDRETDAERPDKAWDIQSPTRLSQLAPMTAGVSFERESSMENAAGWARIMEIENARLLRYRRPVTIVVAEVEGVRRLAERVGEESVQRLLPVVADAFRKEARGSDWLARTGEVRFAALMPETDEIQAINYVERVRLCCEPWLASAAVPLRLAIGWASPPASGDLEFAIRKAEERMNADRRVVGKPALPARTFVPRVVSLPARSIGPQGVAEEAAEPAATDSGSATGSDRGPADGSEQGQPGGAAGSVRHRTRRHTRRGRDDGQALS